MDSSNHIVGKTNGGNIQDSNPWYIIDHTYFYKRFVFVYGYLNFINNKQLKRIFQLTYRQHMSSRLLNFLISKETYYWIFSSCSKCCNTCLQSFSVLILILTQFTRHSLWLAPEAMCKKILVTLIINLTNKIFREIISNKLHNLTNHKI